MNKRSKAFASEFPNVHELIENLTLDQLLTVVAARMEAERQANREREEREWAALLFDADVVVDACDEFEVGEDKLVESGVVAAPTAVPQRKAGGAK